MKTASLQALDEMINKGSLLTHYFYEQKWNNGELTKEELAIYAKEYFHLARSVPGVVTRIRDRAKTEKPELVAEIEKNIKEEEEHIGLWKKFAGTLGISDSEIENYEPHPLVKEAVSELEALADGTFEDGVTAMYAMELALPEISQTKKDGLCKHYNLTSNDAHEYFDEHLNEEEHFAVWRKVEVDPVRAKEVAKLSLSAQHKVLDGVCEMCGFCVTCDS